MVQGAPFQHDIPSQPVSTQGAPFQHDLESSPSVIQGPPVQIVTAAIPTLIQGPPVQFITAAIPALTQGPPVQHTSAAIPTLSQGPPTQIITVPVPATLLVQGPPVRHNSAAIPTITQGPPVQHQTLFVPPLSQGPPVQHTTLAPSGVIPLPPAQAPAAKAEPEPEPAPTFKAVNFGDPEPQEPEDSLNKLTPRQFKFIQRRRAGATGPINLGRFTGPAYPFGPGWADTLGPKPDLNVVFTSVVNILTTPLGTLPYSPGTGSPIPLLVFEINDATTRGLIQRFTEDNLRDQEPRARVLFVRTVVPPDDPNRVIVTVAFQIVGDPERRVYTAPIQFNTLSLAV